jgi:hypothetical protein
MTDEKEVEGLDALIEALKILRKYGNPRWPTHCEHDVLQIMDIDPGKVSEEDTKRLDELGFIVSEESGEDIFISFRFGSA